MPESNTGPKHGASVCRPGLSPTYKNLLALLVLVVGAGQTATAAEPKGGQDAAMQQVLRKAQGVVRQLTQEKAALEAEKTALLGEKASLEAKVKALEESVKRLEPLQGEVERYKASVESLQGAKTGLETQVSQGREQAQNLLKKQRDIIAKAKEIRADNVLLVEAVKEREQWIGQCGKHNQDLQGTNRELLEKYKEKSFWDELLDAEPLTGIGKVKTETAAEEYRYRLQHLKTTPYQAQAPMPGQDSPRPNPLDENAAEGEQP
ncbi:hypothetical protein [Methylomagnum sp.]